MRIFFGRRIVAWGLLALIGVSVFLRLQQGMSAANVGQQSVLVTAEDIKPAACSALFLTNIVSGSGVLTGTAGNDLIIGSTGVDFIDGLGGNDCILGSVDVDTITGNEGNDVCLGGSGIDVFISCEAEAQ